MSPTALEPHSERASEPSSSSRSATTVPETEPNAPLASATATDDVAAPLPRSSAPNVSSMSMQSWVAPVSTGATPSTAVERARRMPRAMHAHDGQLVLRALWTSAKIAAVLFVAYGLMFNFSVVRGSSMTPGIHDGDRILVDHVSYLFGDVHRGDVVVLQYPLDPTLDYVKRVIGLPGDRIEIEGGRVCVNGATLEEPYIADPDPRTHLSVVVQPEHFFVLGDNRPHSSDSREFGQVPRQNLRGKVDVRVWPPERIGSIE